VLRVARALYSGPGDDQGGKSYLLFSENALIVMLVATEEAVEIARLSWRRLAGRGKGGVMARGESLRPPPSSGGVVGGWGEGGGISVLHDLRAHVFSVGQDQGSGEWCRAAQVTSRAAWEKVACRGGRARGASCLTSDLDSS